MNLDRLCGAIISPKETELVRATMAAQGVPVDFAAGSARYRKDFAAWSDSTWKGSPARFAWHGEKRLFGRILKSWVQSNGVCCGMGFGRSMEWAIFAAIARGELRTAGGIDSIPRIAWECWYARSRTLPGHGRINGFGSVGAWMAESVYLSGLWRRAKYGRFDLTRHDESLAAELGRGAGLPAELLAAGQPYRVAGALQCETVDDVRRAVVADFAVARCAPRATRATRDAEGYAGTEPSGGHCEAIAGVYLDRGGDLKFVEQNSWPEGSNPHGGGPLWLRDGSREELPEGAAAISTHDVEIFLKQGEIWAVPPPGKIWKIAA